MKLLIITIISYIIAMILVLNDHGWWAVAFFVAGTLVMPIPTGGKK